MEPAAGSPAEGALRCRIQRETSGPLTTLRGIALARRDVVGTYTLLVVKTGPGGSSRVSQGGRFEVAAGGQAGLGEVRLSLEPDAGFEATLTLDVDGQRIGCEASSATTTPL
ncbi:curli-like amyloid fiber formation chaperone CsgH [Methylobacterium sp. M6A4_1b]